MDVALWVATGLLALVALGGGITKTFVPKAKLDAVRGGGWTRDVSAGFVRTLGVLELLAVPGLFIVPALTAACWVLLMIGAMVTHGRRGEKVAVAANVVYLALAACIVWGRVG